MGGDVERIKQRLDVAEVIGGYVKLERAGASLKGRCPFHNEKTPSFFVSPQRQSYYCFGCGAKGDIFTFVEEMEGVSFREALKSLAAKAGIELTGTRESKQLRSEKERLFEIMEEAATFFERKFAESDTAKKYLITRGLSEESIRKWRIGYAPAEWRALYSHLLQLGFPETIIIKAGLVKPVDKTKGKNPYDVFRDRIIFPLFDSQGEIIAFSGRALSKETEPKYLNGPDTPLFTKSEVLYGLDKAKNEIRKKNYAVLVEGQIDLVLSHQSGIANTVASSGTAFTQAHLERLKKLSPRIILAFDGDAAGEKALEKASLLAISLGLEVKAASLPAGKDPADLVKEDSKSWKDVLRNSVSAIEYFLNRAVENEKDKRKLGIAIGQRILPLISLLRSSMERAHFVSLISKRTGIKEEMVWDDLKKTAKPNPFAETPMPPAIEREEKEKVTQKQRIEERLTEVRAWFSEIGGEGGKEKDSLNLNREKSELERYLALHSLREELSALTVSLAAAESAKDDKEVERLAERIQEVMKEVRNLEEKDKTL